MKKMLCLLLILLLLPIYGVSADEMFTVVHKDITVTYNGEAVEFPDALPLIQNGKTLVPMRPIMERAKLIVDFNGESRTVTAKNDEVFIVMKIDETEATISNGTTKRTVILEEPARIIQDRTYVPVRFVAESLGTKVNWNPYGREVVIIDTDEWKEEINATSDFLGDLIDLPIATQKPFSRSINGTYKYAMNSKSLVTAEGTVAKTADIDLSFVGAGVFDGTNTGYYISVDTDLSALIPFFSSGLTNAELSALKGPATVDLDIVIDKEQNLYIRSRRIQKLLQDMGRTQMAELLGDKYIKIYAADRYTEQELMALLEATKNGKTRWGMFEEFIEKDNMLYSQSAKFLDETLMGYADLYASKDMAISVPSKGAKQWQYTSGETAHGKTALTLAKMFSTDSGFPVSANILTAQRDNLEDASVKTSFSITVKDEMVTRSEISVSVNSPKRAKNTLAYAIHFGSSTRKFDAKKDNSVTLPDNTVSISTLKAAK